MACDASIFEKGLNPMVQPIRGEKVLFQDEAMVELPQLPKDVGGALPGGVICRVEVNKRSRYRDDMRLVILSPLQLLGQVGLTGLICRPPDHWPGERRPGWRMQGLALVT